MMITVLQVARLPNIKVLGSLLYDLNLNAIMIVLVLRSTILSIRLLLCFYAVHLFMISSGSSSHLYFSKKALWLR